MGLLDKVKDTINKGAEAAKPLAERAAEMAREGADKAKPLADKAADKVREGAERARPLAEKAKGRVAGQTPGDGASEAAAADEGVGPAPEPPSAAGPSGPVDTNDDGTLGHG